MSRILVSGLINVETTLRVDGFPIHYTPVRYPFGGVHTTVSGVGYNVAKALTTLGDTVRFASLVGQDSQARLVREALRSEGVPGDFVLSHVKETAQSVILYDAAGRRMINVDLKDLQEQMYPPERFEAALRDVQLAALCNINFSRPFLHIARERGIPIATDVHTLSSLDDDYNRDFMAAADVLFMSDEFLPVAPEDWARQVLARYGPSVVVIGLGEKGALLAVRDGSKVYHIPAVSTRPVVNTIGAGDALFSAFVHGYAQTRDPYAAIHKAVVFASYKIGETGAARGFLTEIELDGWYRRITGSF
ncbi:MAG: carbohydrate kinase family protein [Anaerolineae bacterium]|nr:carbohydrate kinase family protein [Anaerolineae bacterium]